MKLAAVCQALRPDPVSHVLCTVPVQTKRHLETMFTCTSSFDGMTTCLAACAMFMSSVHISSRLRYEPGTFIAHYAGWGPSTERYARIADEIVDPAVSNQYASDVGSVAAAHT